MRMILNADEPGIDAGSLNALTEFATLSDSDLFDLAAAGWPTPLSSSEDNNSDALAEPDETEPLREVVFIDANTPDLDALLADLRNEADPNREFTAILLDANRSGIDQITSALSNLQNVAAVHIVSHGSEGRVELGNDDSGCRQRLKSPECHRILGSRADF
jgi:hypothetical protein